MVALQVKKGTVGQIIKDGEEWASYNFREHAATKDLLFFAEDIVCDPLGHRGPVGGATIGGAWARAGYYGFLRDGWVFLVPMSGVECA